MMSPATVRAGASGGSAPLAACRVAAVVAFALLSAPAAKAQVVSPTRPNVVLIITDDQGYGDLAVHGNPRLRTPNLDRLARQGVRFEAFHVAPVCSPTRASLMTGRYHYRTGVVDTYLGRSLMHGDETTLAEMLAAAGYRTGIFGKWHLGDTSPLRAMDQGFHESLTLNGGGIGQPSDPPGGEHYLDPMLRRNGQWVKSTGYVSDVLTDAAIAFVRANRHRPFFAYLAFNAPHTPLEAPASTLAKYAAMGLEAEDFAGRGHPIPATFDRDTTARVYAMVENIDDNVGRLLTALDESGLAERTIVVFLTDNGPQQPRYNAGLKGLKGTVHDGGIRVPFFLRWPGRAAAGKVVDRIAAHIDVVPTLLDLCGVAPPGNVRLDGVSLLPLIDGDGRGWADRTLFFQWHRGDVPERGRAFAARSQRYKLVQAEGRGERAQPSGTRPQLFDVVADPFEERDLAADHPEIAARLEREYSAWFTDVTRGRDYSDAGVARLHVGAPQENPVRLTRQDWRGPRAGWAPDSLGHWQVDVRRPGRYAVAVWVAPLPHPGTLELSIGDARVRKDVPARTTRVAVDAVWLTRGAATLTATVTTGDRSVGVVDVVVTRLDEAP
jgi:arylsulfatase A-like enzyme